MTGTTSARRPYAPRMAPEQRREHLLDATLRVIAEHGVGKVSMDSVAKEAGVTRPVVYKHFDDTNALLRASLKREEQRAVAQYLAATPSSTERTTLADNLRELYANLLATFEKSPDLWRAILVPADSTTPEFRNRLEHGREHAVQHIVALFGASGVRSDQSTRVDLDLLAHLLLSAIMESGRLLLSDGDEYPPERLVAGVAQVIDTLGVG